MKEVVIIMSENQNKKRFSVVDFFIIFGVVAILLSAGIRLYFNSIKDSEELNDSDREYEEYIVSFACKSIRSTTADFLEASEGDTMFYLTGGENEFGTIESVDTNMPSQIRVELADGSLKYIFAEDESYNDETYDESGNDLHPSDIKRDLTGKFRVKGYRNAADLFYVSGKLYIAPNMSVTVFSQEMSISFTVTDIEKAS